MYSRLFCGNVDTPLEDINVSPANKSEIKLYKIKLSAYQGLVSKLLHHLDETELKRAQKYHFEKDSNSFIIRRALLKIALAEYIGLQIDQITITKHQNKKPYLSSHPSIFFNVSHTKEYALIVIASVSVGVDVEKIDIENDYSDTIKHIFNKTDRDILTATRNQKRTFFTFWTRKEAIVKATGKGISDDFIKIPARDGEHKLKSKLIGDFPYLLVLSFSFDEQFIGSVAFVTNKKNIKQLQFSTLTLLKEKS